MTHEHDEDDRQRHMTRAANLGETSPSLRAHKTLMDFIEAGHVTSFGTESNAEFQAAHVKRMETRRIILDALTAWYEREAQMGW